MNHPPVPADEEGKFLFKMVIYRPCGTAEQAYAMLRTDTDEEAVIDWFEELRAKDLTIVITGANSPVRLVPARSVSELLISNPSQYDLAQLRPNRQEPSS